MRSVALVVLCAALGASLPGCIFNSLSPTQGLSDQVYGLNTESRWDRLDLAVQRVMPRYRARFMSRRQEWGGNIAIADTDVSALVVADDLTSATSQVEISWYDERLMELRTTVLRQHWKNTDNGFLLNDEAVIGGDEALLVIEEEEEAHAELPPTAG